MAQLKISIKPYGITGTFYVNGADAIPKGTTITGAVTCTNTTTLVTGIATTFITDGIRTGDTLYFSVGGSVAYFKVVSVTSETTLIIDSVPTAAVAGPGVAAKISRPMFRYVRIKTTAAGAGTVNGEAISASSEYPFPAYGTTEMPQLPVIPYNVTAGVFEITTL